MTEEKKKINLGFRATPARQEELKIVAAKRRQSVQEMLEAGLTLLLTGGPAAQMEPSSGNRGRNAKWHDLLDEILSDPQERIGIEKNLQWAVDSIRGRKRQVPAPGVVRRAGR